MAAVLIGWECVLFLRLRVLVSMGNSERYGTRWDETLSTRRQDPNTRK